MVVFLSWRGEKEVVRQQIISQSAASFERGEKQEVKVQHMQSQTSGAVFRLTPYQLDAHEDFLMQASGRWLGPMFLQLDHLMARG